VRRVERLTSGRARPAVIPIALFIAAVLLGIAAEFRGLALLVLVSVSAFLAAVALIQSRLNRAWSAAGAAVIGSERFAAPAPGDVDRPHSVSASCAAESTVQPAAPSGE